MSAKDSCAKCLIPSDGAIGTGGPFKRRGLAVGGEVIGDVHFRGTLASWPLVSLFSFTVK